MKSKRIFLTAACSALLSVVAVAQNADSDYTKSFTYFELQGGAQLTATDAKMDKLITPTASFSLGHYFTPVVGARLGVNAWQAKSGFDDTDLYYKWKYITPSLDLMLNLSNVFGKQGDHLLNVVLLGGIGLNYAWDNDELKELSLPLNATPLAWDNNRLSHNLRAGLRLETNQRKPFGLSLEVNANSLDDRFNSKTDDKDDWMFTAQLGLSWRFGHKIGKREKPQAPVTAPVTAQQERPAEPAKQMDASKLQEVFVGNMAPTDNVVDITVKQMPKIPLNVDADEMKYFKNNQDLEYKNMQTTMNAEGLSEITYVEIYNPSNGKTYVYRKMENAPMASTVVEQPKEQTNAVSAMPKQLDTQNIFFDLAKTDVDGTENSKIDAIVKFAKENPKAVISLVGYADKGTGTADINRRYAEQRAKTVKQLLVKRGIKASRIKADSKGDTVQPFTNNDDNRVVIVVSE